MKDVITQRELEAQPRCRRWLPRAGRQPAAKTVVMIQCVGSRDSRAALLSRVCCTEAVKNALKIKQLFPRHECLRPLPRHPNVRVQGELLHESAAERRRLYTLRRGQQTLGFRNGKRLEVNVYDQTLGMPLSIPADLVVLSTGIHPDEDNKKIAQFLKIPLNGDGFFLEAHMKLRPVDFATDGVFLWVWRILPRGSRKASSRPRQPRRAPHPCFRGRLELEGNISFVVDENCDGCAYCVDTCPYKAITLLEYKWQGSIKKTVEVNESICKGCGCCLATCPKKGIYVDSSWNRSRRRSMLLWEWSDGRHFRPLIIAFAATGAPTPGPTWPGCRASSTRHIRIVRVMCSGMVHPNLVIDALTKGADGVLICGCHPGDCHYQEGNHKTEKRADAIRLMLADFGLEEEVSPGMGIRGRRAEVRQGGGGLHRASAEAGR